MFLSFQNTIIMGMRRLLKAAISRSLPILICLGAASGVRGADRDALREIVQTQCVPHWLASNSPLPCASIEVTEGHPELGYALLPDRKGGAHFLLIPTRTVSGIESEWLQDPQAPNYFAAAWDARQALAEKAGRTVPREAVGLAVNSQHARSQDQLHIHIECVQSGVHAALQAALPGLDDDWRPVPVPGWQLVGRRVLGENLRASPFRLLAARLPGAQATMGDYSLLVTGAQFADGPGFVLLAGVGAGTERLLDSTCELAGTRVASGATAR
jgi:CDP-diacylglycerol pyrophosphatase